MDFDFPEPYDLEVPRRIREDRQQLSPEGEEVLERLLAATASLEPTEPPEAIIAAMKPLSHHDIKLLLAMNNLMQEAYEAMAREHQGWADLHGQLAALIERARALDPSLGENATLGEAIPVLKRHGVPLGISDEVLEMIVWVPREE